MSTPSESFPVAQPRATPSRKREKQTRYLSQAIQLEEAINPHIIRSTMSIISLAILAFILWSAFTSIHEVARTPGEVIPHGYQQQVQHLEGGMIRAIHIREGQKVEKGEILISLRDSGSKEDLNRLQSKKNALAMKAERLRAFIDGREANFSTFAEMNERTLTDQQKFFTGMRLAREKEEEILKSQIIDKIHIISGLDQELEVMARNHEITRNVYQRRKKLFKKGYSSHIRMLEDEKMLNDIEGNINKLLNQIATANNDLDQARTRLSSLSARHRDEAFEKLSTLNAESEQNQQSLNKLQQRVNRLELRAPTTGMITGLAVNTVGAVVKPGETLLEIIPLSQKLEVEVKISPQDIGHVTLGQDVQVKFSSFDFSRYGFISGTLTQISASTFDGQQGERYYQGIIELSQPYVGDNPDHAILPGMTVMADIITGEKTILQYLLKPIQLSLQTAFRER